MRHTKHSLPKMLSGGFLHSFFSSDNLAKIELINKYAGQYKRLQISYIHSFDQPADAALLRIRPYFLEAFHNFGTFRPSNYPNG